VVGAVPADVAAVARAMGVVIPPAPRPQGSYLPAAIHGGIAYSSGMGPMLDGERRHLGYVGCDVTLEQARAAARIAVLNAVAAVAEAAGGLEKITRILRITGYVRSAPNFTNQVGVLNAASELLTDLFGERGQHARSAIGVAELPFGIPVEIELVAAIQDEAVEARQ
jgi:enamine deaminase RidA (YjgF/YER057c/UK114 family)